MPGGRPRKPTRLKVLQGNPGKRRLPKREPEPAALEDLAAPAWLKGHALEEWKRVTPELQRLGLLTIVDVAALAGYCQAFARWRQAKDAVDEEKSVDVAIARGLVKMEKEALAQMKALAGEFGFTPASRSRVAGAGKPPEEKDPFEEWAKGKVIQGGKKD